MGAQTDLIKKPAPTLYAIIALKLLKGSLFLAIAIIAFTLSDNDLPADFQNFLHHLRLNPERKFWADLARRIGALTEVKMLWTAAGTLVYSMFSLIEGVGLIFRVRWAGWMAICESAFFIPIEIYELVHHNPRDPGQPQRSGHPILITVILAINIWIVWYLVKNKHRLFRHHLHS